MGAFSSRSELDEGPMSAPVAGNPQPKFSVAFVSFLSTASSRAAMLECGIP